MKVSLRWIKSLGYKDDGDRAALTQRIGQRLGAIEEVVDLGAKYQHAFIVRVDSAEKHPDADKLSVCLVDDDGQAKGVDRNDDGLIQVVCGAPNVKAGMMAVWLPPGAITPQSLSGDHFQLDSREIRGQTSHGMLASEAELDLGSGHNGILDMSEGDYQSGVGLAEALGLDDYIIDIENKMLTNRADCFGMIGLAREVCAISGQQFTSPDWFEATDFVSDKAEDNIPLQVEVNDYDVCNYLSGLVFKDVKIQPSPLWLKSQLAVMGQKSINNIVDLTNYVMLLTSQPVHAFDYDKLQSVSGGPVEVGVRSSKKGEKLKLLDGTELDLEDGAALVTCADKPVALAGIMGGAETEVDQSTATIVLEAGNFDMYNLRRTSYKYGVTSEALTRFSKGPRPELTMTARAIFAGAMMSEGWGVPASRVVESNELKPNNASIRVGEDHLRRIVGYEIDAGEVVQVLQRAEIEANYDQGEFVVNVPFWRSDLKIAEDIIEEVSRITGFDRSPAELPLVAMRQSKIDEVFSLENRLRSILANLGAQEQLLYSFVSEKLLDSTGLDSQKGLRISNALSPELQRYRTSITPGLLSKVNSNIRGGKSQLAMFEIGRAHLADNMDGEGLPQEYHCLSFVFAQSDKQARTAKLGEVFYVAKRYLVSLLEELGYGESDVKLHADLDGLGKIQNETQAALGLRAAIAVDSRIVGVIGLPHNNARKAHKLPKDCAVFEIDNRALLQALRSQRTLQPFVAPLPTTDKDITLEIGATDSVSQILDTAAELGSERLVVDQPARVEWELIDIFKPEDQDVKRVSLRFELMPTEKTLTADQANAWLEHSVQQLQSLSTVKRVV